MQLQNYTVFQYAQDMDWSWKKKQMLDLSTHSTQLTLRSDSLLKEMKEEEEDKKMEHSM